MIAPTTTLITALPIRITGKAFLFGFSAYHTQYLRDGVNEKSIMLKHKQITTVYLYQKLSSLGKIRLPVDIFNSFLYIFQYGQCHSLS